MAGLVAPQVTSNSQGEFFILLSLEVAAEQSSKRVPTVDEVDEHVEWHLAEAPLQMTDADVFEIFDCCYAGDSRNGHFSERSFQFLAATSAGHVTRTPGPHSITSGLIWALIQLAEERGKFTTSELSDKVRDSPGFPKHQVPVLYDRGRPSWKRIVLAPLSEEPLEQSCTSLSSNPVQPRQSYQGGLTQPGHSSSCQLGRYTRTGKYVDAPMQTSAAHVPYPFPSL